jgi:hypothetical protein
MTNDQSSGPDDAGGANAALGRQVIEEIRAAASHLPQPEVSAPSGPFLLLQDEGQPSREEVERWGELSEKLRRIGQPQETSVTTKAQFDEAARRLLGEEKYANLLRSGFSRPDFCREIAQDEFVDNLFSPSTKHADLDLIRRVADRLWKGDGVTGLDD